MRLTGTVVHGKGLGKTVGMPTANLAVSEQQLPAAGVYATRIYIGDEAYMSVTNIGTRPSVDDETYTTIETFILDFEGNLYGETVTLDVMEYLRPVMKFNNLDEVSEQVQKDIERARKCL